MVKETLVPELRENMDKNRLECLKLAFEVAFKSEAFHKRQTPEERYGALSGVLELSNALDEYITNGTLLED